MAKFASRPAERNGESAAAALVDSGVVGTRYPALVEYLTLDRWDDGESRRTATLLLFCEAGRWTACLNDRECGRSAWASGDTPEAALDALEDGIANDCAAWRVSGQQKFEKRRK